MQGLGLLIDGAVVAGAERLAVINPATGAVFAEAPRASPAQLEHAIAVACRAFGPWAARPLADRRAALLDAADAMERRMDAFAQVLTLEQGKPLTEAYGEVGASVAALRTFAGLDLPLETLRDDAGGRILRQRFPLGVTATITPWNFPLLLLMVKLAPALLMGNSVVAKPAPTTPLTTLMFGELCADIFPPGVLNVLVDHHDLGPLLASHPDVAKVAFTGSTPTGRKIMANGAATLKRLTLELGGNDPAIVLQDADLETVAPALFAAAMPASGQVCVAIKRIYAHAAVHDELCERLAALARDAVVGDGLEPGVQIGPVQNIAQYERLKHYLAEAHAEGTVLAGGQALNRPGYFIPPTIVRDLPDSARLVREEQFGPILPILKFSEEAAAIARANNSEYGLGASVWTADRERGLEVALQLEAGAVWVNKHLEAAFDLPYCAAKQSGQGFEMGPEGVAEFTQSKIINIAN